MGRNKVVVWSLRDYCDGPGRTCNIFFDNLILLFTNTDALLQTKNPPDSLITEWLASETEQARAYHNGRFYLFKLLAQGVALVSPNDFTVS